MKRIIFLFLIVHCTLTIDNCLSQTQFQRAIGGTGWDDGFSTIQTTDGGYALAGLASFGAGYTDMYIVKLDGSGTLQWSRTVGGTNNEEAWSIIQTTDGGYAMAGYTESFGAGSYNFYIVKLDASGTLQWSRTVGQTGASSFAYSIVQTTDGGYAVAGQTWSFGTVSRDMYIVKLDSSGTLQWSKTVGGTDYEEARSIIQTPDGGYAVAGSTQSFGAGNYDMYIVKLDGSGTLQWSRTVGGTGYEADDYKISIVQTTDSGYAVASYTSSFGAGSADMYIVKLNGSGTLQWTRTVGGTGSDYAYSIIQTTDGGYAAAGWTNSFGAGLWDIYIVKLDGGGTLQWSKTVGGTTYDAGYSIIQTTNGGYAVFGGTQSFGAGSGDMYIVKFDSSWNTCGNSSSPSSISGTGGTLGTPPSIVNTPTSDVFTPTSLTNTGGTLTVICPPVGIQPISNELPNSYQLYQNYPNPFNPTTKIKFALPKNSFAKLVVYDMLGRGVVTLVNEELQRGTYEIEWNASNYPSGVYFYTLTAGEFSQTNKMILLK